MVDPMAGEKVVWRDKILVDSLGESLDVLWDDATAVSLVERLVLILAVLTVGMRGVLWVALLAALWGVQSADNEASMTAKLRVGLMGIVMGYTTVVVKVSQMESKWVVRKDVWMDVEKDDCWGNVWVVESVEIRAAE